MQTYLKTSQGGHNTLQGGRANKNLPINIKHIQVDKWYLEQEGLTKGACYTGVQLCKSWQDTSDICNSTIKSCMMHSVTHNYFGQDTDFSSNLVYNDNPITVQSTNILE